MSAAYEHGTNLGAGLEGREEHARVEVCLRAVSPGEGRGPGCSLCSVKSKVGAFSPPCPLANSQISWGVTAARPVKLPQSAQRKYKNTPLEHTYQENGPWYHEYTNETSRSIAVLFKNQQFSPGVVPENVRCGLVVALKGDLFLLAIVSGFEGPTNTL